MICYDNSSPGFDSVRQRLEDYGEQVDVWKNDHQRAMYCMEFELLLEHGLSLLAQLNSIDEKIRLKFFRGEVEYDSQYDDILTGYYQQWLKPCDKLLAELKSLKNEGFSVERAEEFRSACREVQGILTDDDEFFTGDALKVLQDQAIDEYRAGRCEPF